MNVNTLAHAVEQINSARWDSKLVLKNDNWADEIFSRGHVAYGTTFTFDFAIDTIKGKHTKKYFHVSLYRTTDGLYEVTAYVL